MVTKEQGKWKSNGSGDGLGCKDTEMEHESTVGHQGAAGESEGKVQDGKDMSREDVDGALEAGLSLVQEEFSSPPHGEA